MEQILVEIRKALSSLSGHLPLMIAVVALLVAAVAVLKPEVASPREARLVPLSDLMDELSATLSKVDEKIVEMGYEFQNATLDLVTTSATKISGGGKAVFIGVSSAASTKDAVKFSVTVEPPSQPVSGRAARLAQTILVNLEDAVNAAGADFSVASFKLAYTFATDDSVAGGVEIDAGQIQLEAGAETAFGNSSGMTLSFRKRY